MYRRNAPGKIIAARVTTYSDSGQVMAHIEWEGGATTSGDPANGHMAALLARAEREGLTIVREVW